MCNGPKWIIRKTRVLHSLLDHSSHDLSWWIEWKIKIMVTNFGSPHPNLICLKNFRTRIYLSQGRKHYRPLILLLLNSQVTAHTQRIHWLQFGFSWNSVFKEIWSLSLHFIVIVHSYKHVPWKPRILTNYTSHHSYLFSL